MAAGGPIPYNSYIEDEYAPPPNSYTYTQVCTGVSADQPESKFNFGFTPEQIAAHCQEWSNWTAFYTKTRKHCGHIKLLEVVWQCQEGLETEEGEERLPWILDLKRDSLLTTTCDWFIHCADLIYQAMSIEGERRHDDGQERAA